ncbi:S9 family peptidase [Microbacterium rhizomatis]|uniref:S9 family peptidase n=1 Tax=Microbacterium rhizomatis TaxID=1631477 RepID=A0A5J5J573_9MICO|nr:S9 family peptidase [Microbacterium rhizomatis]KAA9110609.1 S9 family peptidase [Microbacterium rhizomatis]
MRASDIEKLVALSRPNLSPTGDFVVFAASRPDIRANQNVGQLWRLDLDDHSPAPRRLTRGAADSAPRLSPDGAVVAFLRADAKKRAQLHVVAAHGGEPVQVTDQPLGVGSFAWSPDGGRIVFTARVPESGRYGSIEGLDAAAEAPRRVTGVRWHANGIGYTLDRPAHVFVVDAPDPGAEPLYAAAPAVLAEGATAPAAVRVPAAPTALTSGSHDHGGVVFTRDGTEVLTTVDEVEPLRRDLRSRIVAVRVDGTGEREVLGREANLSVDDVAVADDGTIAILAADVGPEGRDFVAPGVALWIVEPSGPRRLTDPEAADLGEAGSHITPIGTQFLVQNRTRGRVHLLSVARDGSTTDVSTGDVEVTGHDAVARADSPGGVRVVAALADATSFGDLVVVGEGIRTDFGGALRDAGLVAPREIAVEGRDGYRVHGWVAAPGGEGPHPVILMIHGGPFASYGIHPFDEVQTLVDAGYAVVYGNPRGSAGYGRAHGRSIRQAMGTVDFADVIDLLEGAIASDASLDGSRVGVMGGSYGGYLTAWVIAHDHRFAGAIVERGFLDPVSFQGTSDIGSFFGDEYVGTDAAAIARQSPMAVVDQVTTPTLVVHSELDYRCPLEQATRYYSALKRSGTEAEMLIFPGENHELSRAGQPRHRVERIDAVLDWWARRLPVVR